ncbi:hypothetical protein I4U23_003679 [Adineta vaga]|nr:hypothetical protein I4U23_003679 [Adineta vaga]UJR16780.1 hypothetical protein I4U23_003679 [Adineta vaga]
MSTTRAAATTAGLFRPQTQNQAAKRDAWYGPYGRWGRGWGPSWGWGPMPYSGWGGWGWGGWDPFWW